MESVEDLINAIKDNRINPLEEDRMVWKLTKDDIFSVKSSFDPLGGGVARLPSSQKGYPGINVFPPE